MRNFLIWLLEPFYRGLTVYLSACGFILYGGGKGGSPAAPDYGPMAAASEKAAELGTQLGREQLAESTRQYEENMKIAKPIIDAQLGLMKQGIDQGNDYYNYMVKNQRPVEEALNAQSMKDGSEAQQSEYAARAQADTLKGYTQAMNIAMRQGQRYGASTDSIAAQAGNQAGAMASSLAQAAGAGRQQSQDLGWARKMDVAGLYRGLTGASQGAYGLALNSGNAAMGNQMAPGQSLLNGMAQGAGMQQNGMGQKIQGLGNVLSAQTSVYNNAMANQSGGLDIGGLLGGAGGLIGAGVKAGWFSSKKLKEDKAPVSESEITKALTRIPIEKWRYKDGVADEGEHIGPYAEDVYREFGDQAAPDGKMLDPISMNGITIAAIKNLAERMAKIERGKKDA